jgi:glucose-1-phosphatase
MTIQEMENTKILLFDLGGVLVELGGMSTMLDWIGNELNEDELMEAWLKSEAVRQFESGKCSADTFADRIIAEFNLPVSRKGFIDEFKRWPSGLFPGVKKTLGQLRSQFTLVSLSNTNEIHWPVNMEGLGLVSLFDKHYPSHQTGIFKPDPEAFEQVIQGFQVDPANILFFDDSRINIESAMVLGIPSVRVKGFEAVRKVLVNRGLVAVA